MPEEKNKNPNQDHSKKGEANIQKGENFEKAQNRTEHIHESKLPDFEFTPVPPKPKSDATDNTGD